MLVRVMRAFTVALVVASVSLADPVKLNATVTSNGGVPQAADLSLQVR